MAPESRHPKESERRGAGGWERVLEREGPVPAGREWSSALWRQAEAQFHSAARALDLPQELYERLLLPRRILTVTLPVRMNSGKVRVFTGYRARHSRLIGPTKGGIRIAPGVSLGECAALSL